MACGVAYLLPLFLLVLLSPGSWEQKSELLKVLEGQKISVKCSYQSQQATNKKKFWCKVTQAEQCLVVASSSRYPWRPQFSIQDYPRYGYFIVTMTKLKVEDSGTYWCGFGDHFQKSIHLLVTPTSTPSTTTRTTSTSVPSTTWRTTAWTSATSPVAGSPPGNWKLITVSVVVAVLLLVLGLSLILILCLKKARRIVEKDKDECYHTYDNLSVPKEEASAYMKKPSPGYTASPLSWDPDQQMDPGEGTGILCYASLTHLNYLGTKDSIYMNTYPTAKPTPDSSLSVEYASIIAKRPSMSTVLEGGIQDLKA